MGLMTSADWERMAAELAAVRDDNAVSVSIKRGAAVLPAQTVRIARSASMGQQVDPGGVQQAAGRVVVLGAVGLNIQPSDRFVVAGNVYEVVLVRPNRRAATVAEAKLVQ